MKRQVTTQGKDIEGDTEQSCRKSHTHGERNRGCGPDEEEATVAFWGWKAFIKEEALWGAKGFG